MTKEEVLVDTISNEELPDEEKYIYDFIDDEYEAIYNKYCDLYPEDVTSDFTIEDIDICDFVISNMEKEFDEYIEERKDKNN